MEKRVYLVTFIAPLKNCSQIVTICLSVQRRTVVLNWELVKRHCINVKRLKTYFCMGKKPFDFGKQHNCVGFNNWILGKSFFPLSDISIGAYMSDSVAVIRARPVHTVSANIWFPEPVISWQRPNCSKTSDDQRFFATLMISFNYTIPNKEKQNISESKRCHWLLIPLSDSKFICCKSIILSMLFYLLYTPSYLIYSVYQFAHIVCDHSVSISLWSIRFYFLRSVIKTRL